MKFPYYSPPLFSKERLGHTIGSNKKFKYKNVNVVAGDKIQLDEFKVDGRNAFRVAYYAGGTSAFNDINIYYEATTKKDFYGGDVRLFNMKEVLTTKADEYGGGFSQNDERIFGSYWRLMLENTGTADISINHVEVTIIP